MVQLLTIPQVAAALAISRSKVYTYIGSGELASIRIGGSRRVASYELERFVNELSALSL